MIPPLCACGHPEADHSPESGCANEECFCIEFEAETDDDDGDDVEGGRLSE